MDFRFKPCNGGTEEALKGTEETFWLILDAAEDVLSLHALDGRVLYASPSLWRLTGFRPEELLGTEGNDLVHPDDRERLGQEMAPLRTGKGHAEADWRCRTRDGSYRRVHTRAKTLADDQGQPYHFLCVTADVTERRRVEKALRESHTLLRAVTEGTTDAVYVKDREGRYLTVNPALARLVGRPADEVVGKTDAELLHPDSAREVREHDRRIMELGQPQTYEQVVTAAGATRTLLVTKGPYRDAEGRVAGVFAIARDVSERKALERQLREAHKMEAVGRLAGGIAHDFNNLLTVILGYTELLLEQAPAGTEAHAPLTEIRRAADRAAELTRQLLAFSRRQPAAPVVLDLNGSLRDLDEVLRRLAGDGVRLVLRLAPGLRRIKADPTQVEQILLNLAGNARDAMSDGGELTLATENVTVAAGATPAGPPPGEYVRLTVRDTGVGMDEATLGHIFEPFFTTKEVGSGSGLGLATVYGLMRQCGGHIAAASEPGRGTTFTLHFPVAEVPGAGPGPGSGRTVLLVEDEPAIRALARQVLEQQGHQVLEARDGLEALEVYERHEGPIHLLLTDLVMPHLSGPELARRLLARGAPLRLLFMSGYARDTEAFTQPILGRRPHFLPKPFSLAGLLDKVREALSAEEPPGAAAAGPAGPTADSG
jgi:PAS domain S-box-containing protein